MPQKNIRLDMTGWRKWFTGNYARNWDFTIQTSGICITQTSSWRMRCTKLSGILRYKQKTRPSDTKKRTNWLVDFDILAAHRVKIKENEKTRPVLRPCPGTKKAMEHEGDSDATCNWCTGNDPKGLIKWLEVLEIRGWAKTIHTMTLLRLAWILRRDLETWGVLLSLRCPWKTTS